MKMSDATDMGRSDAMRERKQNTPFRLSTLFLSTALASAALALPNAVTAASLDEIIVTAQKREQGINDVGITVNAFTAQQLQNYGIQSAEDLETITPGLTITDAQPSGVPVFTIRGVGFADFTPAASSTVGLYFDEVNLPYSVMSRGILFDVERVEVLKGPQGDLYGRNTTGGQINFVSRKPTEEFSGGIMASYSRFDVFDAEWHEFLKCSIFCPHEQDKISCGELCHQP